MELGLEAKGIDIDSEVIASATEAFGPHFEKISIQDLAARGDKFDMVYANEVIEHLPEPESFIAAVSEALVPGGFFYVTCPDGGHPRVPRDFASWPMVCPPDHLTFFSRAGLEKLFARHGFQIKKYQISFKPGIKAMFVKVA